MLSQSQMHIDERDEIGLTMQQWKRRNLDALIARGCFLITTSVTAARIYRKDMPRVTASCNRLDLSLSKRIRHGLVTKINGKRKSRTCEDLCPISVYYSHACRAPTTIAPPDEARRASACIFLPFSSPPHTYKYI
jgi:hypothetical protein